MRLARVGAGGRPSTLVHCIGSAHLPPCSRIPPARPCAGPSLAPPSRAKGSGPIAPGVTAGRPQSGRGTAADAPQRWDGGSDSTHRMPVGSSLLMSLGTLPPGSSAVLPVPILGATGRLGCGEVERGARRRGHGLQLQPSKSQRRIQRGAKGRAVTRPILILYS